jgi:hypothetical protein
LSWILFSKKIRILNEFLEIQLLWFMTRFESRDAHGCGE